MGIRDKLISGKLETEKAKMDDGCEIKIAEFSRKLDASVTDSKRLSDAAIAIWDSNLNYISDPDAYSTLDSAERHRLDAVSEAWQSSKKEYDEIWPVCEIDEDAKRDMMESMSQLKEFWEDAVRARKALDTFAI